MTKVKLKLSAEPAKVLKSDSVKPTDTTPKVTDTADVPKGVGGIYIHIGNGKRAKA